MTTKVIAAIVAVFVLVMSGSMYYKTVNSYAYHLGKANGALEQLQLFIEGKQSTALIPTAYAKSKEVFVDEESVTELTEEVVSETEEAIETIEKANDAAKIAEALTEVGAVQDKTVDILFHVTDVVKSDTTAEVVGIALETTTMQRISVVAAIEKVRTAYESGTKEVQIDLPTSKDTAAGSFIAEARTHEIHVAEAVANAKAAMAALNVLISSGKVSDNEVAKLADKMNRIGEALEEGRAGHVHGLTAAVRSKVLDLAIETGSKDLILEEFASTPEFDPTRSEDGAQPAE